MVFEAQAGTIGAWYGMVIETTGTVLVADLDVSEARVGITIAGGGDSVLLDGVTIHDVQTAGVTVGEGAPQITDLDVRGAQDGLTVTGGSPVIDGCVIADNCRYGGYSRRPTVVVRGSIVANNGSYGVRRTDSGYGALAVQYPRTWPDPRWRGLDSRRPRLDSYGSPSSVRGRTAPPASPSPPLEFIERLAALVPPPRAHLVHYHGVFAGRSAWRREVVPGRTGT